MNVYLGSRLLATGYCGEAWYSSALLCPKCGEVWGRVFRAGEWSASLLPCPKHGTSYKPGGSFWQELDWHPGTSGKPFTAPSVLEGFLERNPELARHEFLVHLAWAEGNQ